MLLLFVMHLFLIFIGFMVSYCMLTFQGPEELFETISQALLSSVDRDCLSGWGGHVYVV